MLVDCIRSLQWCQALIRKFLILFVLPNRVHMITGHYHFSSTFKHTRIINVIFVVRKFHTVEEKLTIRAKEVATMDGDVVLLS